MDSKNLITSGTSEPQNCIITKPIFSKKSEHLAAPWIVLLILSICLTWYNKFKFDYKLYFFGDLEISNENHTMNNKNIPTIRNRTIESTETLARTWQTSRIMNNNNIPQLRIKKILKSLRLFERILSSLHCITFHDFKNRFITFCSKTIW